VHFGLAILKRLNAIEVAEQDRVIVRFIVRGKSSVNAAHIHLVVNHAPLFAAIFGTVLVAYAMERRQRAVQIVGYSTLIVAEIAAAVAYATGGGAEHAVEGLPGVTEALVERHQYVATVALIVTALLGSLGIAGLYQAVRGSSSGAVAYAAVTVGCAAFLILGYASNLGGQIRHTEIRASSSTNPQRQEIAPPRQPVLGNRDD
jgi:hypothetical protein